MDERLRKLERRLRSPGAAADRAAWLRERQRLGELAQAQVELAYQLGDEAAAALCTEKRSEPKLKKALAAWVAEGPEPLVRAGLACCTALVPAARQLMAEDLETFEDVVRTATAWLLAEDKRARAAADGHLRLLAQRMKGFRGRHIVEGRGDVGRMILVLKTSLQFQGLAADCLRGAHGKGKARTDAMRACLELAQKALDALPERPGSSCAAAFAAQLVPWLLGEGDPVAELPRPSAKELVGRVADVVAARRARPRARPLPARVRAGERLYWFDYWALRERSGASAAAEYLGRQGLAPDLLELLAYLGHQPARLALGREQAAEEEVSWSRADPAEQLQALVQGLAPHRDAVRRLAPRPLEHLLLEFAGASTWATWDPERWSLDAALGGAKYVPRGEGRADCIARSVLDGLVMAALWPVLVDSDPRFQRGSP